MTDIAAIESRLASALDRIGRSVEVMSSGPDGSGEVAALKQKLAEEETANAQLAERVKALAERQDQMAGPLESKVAAQEDQIAQLGDELEKLRAANADLTDIASKLRDAASTGAADAEMINRAVIAELDAVKAARSADAAELGALLTQLKPIVEGA